jgi:plastocyanin
MPLIFLFSFILTVFLPKAALAHEIEDTTVIHITDKAFEPNQIEIQQGKAIVFENIGQNDHWPASDLHPSHQIYPEFDPQKALQPGETWEFVFEKAGNWNMHDHNYPKMTGNIRVIPNGSAAPILPERTTFTLSETIEFTIKKILYKLLPSQKQKALSSLDLLNTSGDRVKLSHTLKVFSPSEVMNSLLDQSDNGELADCHQQAHQIGHAAYTLYGADTFRQGNMLCHSGFYHGAMEALLQEQGVSDLNTNITSLCEEFPTNFGQFECLHGIGHGVLAYSNYDLPRALETCKTLKDTFQQSSCYGGVFMENIVTAQGRGASLSHSTSWTSEDPHFPCNTLQDQEQQTQCYMMQTSWMLTLFKNDFGKASAECLEVPSDLTSTCFQSLGRDAAGITLRDPEKILSICELSDQEENRFACIRGGLNVIIDFWGEKLEGQAVELCNLIENKGHKRECFITIAQRLSEIYTSDHNRNDSVCANAGDYFDTCMGN